MAKPTCLQWYWRGNYSITTFDFPEPLQAGALSGHLLARGASYSSTPQALILINKLQPSIERMADFAGVQINKSLDRYEEREKRWEEKRAEWEMEKGENK